MESTEFTLDLFLNLCNILINPQCFTSEQFKQAEMQLQNFSKTHAAWAITLQILSLEKIDQKIYFQAASMLKNKMKYDYSMLKNTNPVLG